ncbi:glycosyltransferase family 4 protein [Mesotoga sp.]|uniref:glycosyltransferase family 4 protein n=1 Tax=Mesotoga sp. TaxID=2053577 RepID=UPI00345EEC7B
MKVCVITTVHPPDDVRINRELRSLVKAGHEVSFIAPEGNFDIEGVEYLTVSKQKGRVKRFLRGSSEAFSKAIEVNADVYHFHDPELIGLGKKLKRHGKKVIYDIHEDYPSVIMMKNWIPAWIRPLVSKTFALYQSAAIKKFDAIVITVREYLTSISKYNELAIVPNYPELELLQELSVGTVDSDTGPVRFIYVGSLDDDRAIIESIEAFKILKDKGVDLTLELVGPVYSSRIQESIDETLEKYPEFSFSPRMPYLEAMKKVAESHVGLLIVHKGKSKEESSPLKLFEYMALGKPQIASDFTAWRKILDRGPCALYVDPENVTQIAQRMREFCENRALIREMGSKAKMLSKSFQWSASEKEMLALYERLEACGMNSIYFGEDS